MPGVSVVDSGNYDLQIATGFQVDAFVLDDTLKGVLNNTEYVLDGTTEFASVIDGATGISVFRGRRDIGDQFMVERGTPITVNVNGGLATSADIGRAVVNSIKAMNRVDGPAQIQVA